MRQLRALLFLLVVSLTTLATVGAVESTTPGRVNAANVNVRSGPALSDRVLGVVKQGEIVQVVAQKGNWFEILYPAGCYMWISAKYVKVDEPSGNNWGDGVKGAIAGSRVRIRVSPDLKAAIIREAEYKEEVTVLGKKGDWYFLKADTDLRAYISSSLVDLEKVEPKPTPKVQPEQSVSAKPEAEKAPIALSVPVENKLPAITPVVEEAQKVSEMQLRAERRIQESGATAFGVLERVPPTTEADTGCAFRLLVGGIPVNYLRSATLNLEKFVGQKVAIHGSQGTKAANRDQRIINVEFVELCKD